jgi:uncharacterized membrane protein YccC
MSDHRPEVRHSARVALGLLVPGMSLLVSGHPELMLYPAFGSFVGMYGRHEAPRERLRHQLHGAGMLVTGVAIGTVFSTEHVAPVFLIFGVTAFATGGSILTDWLRLRPGGPFFGIFALGATATVDPGLVDAWVGLTLCAVTAGLALVLGWIDAMVEHRGRSTPSDEPAQRQRLPSGTLAQAVRYALATASAGTAGWFLGIDHANWAMAAAAVPLAVITSGDRLDLRAVIHRARHRLTGTFVGLVVTGCILSLHPGPGMLAAAVMVLLFPTELFMTRHYGVALGFFTPLIMIMTELATAADPVALLVARGADTVVGVGAGVAAAGLIAGPTSRPRSADACV